MLDLGHRILLVKIAKHCLSCKDCKKSSEKSEYQQSLLSMILDISDAVEFHGEKEEKSITQLITELTKICFKCKGESALIHKKVSDYLEKFGNTEDKFSKKGKIFAISSKTEKVKKS